MSAVRAWLMLVLLTLPPTSNAAMRAVLRPPQTGIASWYGWSFNGRKMANGDRFHALGLTAASLFLPLGTRVRVTNLENGRSCEVTITDRGPYIHNRMIDLSLGAARLLGMVEGGLARVRVDLLSATKR